MRIIQALVVVIIIMSHCCVVCIKPLCQMKSQPVFCSQTLPDYSNDEELCRNLKYFLQQLPQLNYGLLRFLCRFLASVATFQQESWNTGALAAVFGPDIFQ